MLLRTKGCSSGQLLGQASKALQGINRDAIVHPILMGAGIDDPKVVELQRFHGTVKRFADLGGLAEFIVNPQAPAAAEKKEVRLSTAVGGPKVSFRWPEDAASLLQGKPHPTAPAGCDGRESSEGCETLPSP